MKYACADIEEEIAELESESAAALQLLKTTVDDFSDLQYGRIHNEDLREQVIHSLRRIT